MKLKIFLPLGMLILLMACAPSTTLTKSWTDPSINSETVQAFEKILVIARINDETSNRIAEDKIVSQMKPGVAFPSYSILSSSDTAVKTVDAKLQKEGFDGLLVMQLTEVNKSLNVEPATYGYRGFYGARYGYGYPGTISEDQTFNVQTSIYSLETNKLIWSGTTSTYNPSQLEAALEDIIVAIKTELTSKGLLK